MNRIVTAARYLPVIILAFLMLMSCNKAVPGCTDESADNYNFEANEDDGSCTFSGELTFWYNNETRDSLIVNDIENVMPLVGDEYSTNIQPDFILWSSEPECKTSAVGRLKINLGNQKSKMIHFRVAINDVNDIYWEDSSLLNHNGCELYQMIW